MVESIIFYVFAISTLVTATAVVTVRNPVHAALFLVLTFFTSAVIWLTLEAEFLAIAVKADPRPTIMEILKTTACPTTAAIVLTSVVFLRDCLEIDFKLSRSDVRAEGRFVNHRLLYLVDGKNRK